MELCYNYNLKKKQNRQTNKKNPQNKQKKTPQQQQQQNPKAKQPTQKGYMWPFPSSLKIIFLRVYLIFLESHIKMYPEKTSLLWPVSSLKIPFLLTQMYSIV